MASTTSAASPVASPDGFANATASCPPTPLGKLAYPKKSRIEKTMTLAAHVAAGTSVVLRNGERYDLLGPRCSLGTSAPVIQQYLATAKSYSQVHDAQGAVWYNDNGVKMALFEHSDHTPVAVQDGFEDVATLQKRLKASHGKKAKAAVKRAQDDLSRVVTHQQTNVQLHHSNGQLLAQLSANYAQQSSVYRQQGQALADTVHAMGEISDVMGGNVGNSWLPTVGGPMVPAVNGAQAEPPRKKLERPKRAAAQSDGMPSRSMSSNSFEEGHEEEDEQGEVEAFREKERKCIRKQFPHLDDDAMAQEVERRLQRLMDVRKKWHVSETDEGSRSSHTMGSASESLSRATKGSDGDVSDGEDYDIEDYDMPPRTRSPALAPFVEYPSDEDAEGDGSVHRSMGIKKKMKKGSFKEWRVSKDRRICMGLQKKQLKSIAQGYGLSTSGNKADLVNRIVDAKSQQKPTGIAKKRTAAQGNTALARKSSKAKAAPPPPPATAASGQITASSRSSAASSSRQPPPQNIQDRMPGAPDPPWLSGYPRRVQFNKRHFGWNVQRTCDGKIGIVKAVNGETVHLEWDQKVETPADVAQAGPRAAHPLLTSVATTEDKFEDKVRRGKLTLLPPQQDPDLINWGPTCGPPCHACGELLGVGATAWTRCWNPACYQPEPGAHAGTGARANKKGRKHEWAVSTLAVDAPSDWDDSS